MDRTLRLWKTNSQFQTLLERNQRLIEIAQRRQEHLDHYGIDHPPRNPYFIGPLTKPPLHPKFSRVTIPPRAPSELNKPKVAQIPPKVKIYPELTLLYSEKI